MEMSLLDTIHYYFNLTSAIFLTIVGVVGNTIVTLILMRKKFHPAAMFRYLIVFTISSTLALFTIWPYNLPDLFSMDTNATNCKLINYYSYTMSIYAQWVLVLSSIDRWVNVKYPSKFHIRNNTIFQVSIMTVLFISTALFCIVYINYYDLQVYENSTYCGCVDALTSFYIDTLQLVLSTITPFIIMLFCTVSIIKRLKKSQNMFGNNTDRINRENQLAKVMLFLDIFFLILNLPFCIYLVVYDVLALNNIYLDIADFLYDITDAIFFSYLATEIFVLIACNKLFRQEFISLFHYKKKIKTPVFSISNKPKTTINERNISLFFSRHKSRHSNRVGSV